MKHHKGKLEGRNRFSKSEMREMLYHRRFVLPNAVTMGNMFAGFLGIIYASSGRFVNACWAIVAAIILDGFDGRVARRFNATSKFGLEFDSMSDLVSFGVAPAILMYHWGFKSLADEFGVLVCFIYCICAASRLARFNVTETNLKSFEGLPSPAGAGIIVAFIWSFINFEVSIDYLELWIALFSLITAGTGFLMVSHIEYPSIKRLKMQNAPMRSLLVIGALIAGIWYVPRTISVIIFIGYGLSAFVAMWIKRDKNKEYKTVESVVTPISVSSAEEPVKQENNNQE